MNTIIKVCGMTDAENIRAVEELGVDMIGFIFYHKSPRCICQMPEYLPTKAKRVGVFVNETKENIHMVHQDGIKLQHSAIPSKAIHYLL